MDSSYERFGSEPDGGVPVRKRPAVYAVIRNAEGQVGVARTPYGYFLPGGGLEGDETPLQGLKRECSEEIGYEIEVGPYIGRACQYTKSIFSDEPLKIIGDFYQARLVAPNGLKTEDDHELVWLAPREAEARMHTEFASWAIRQAVSERPKE